MSEHAQSNKAQPNQIVINNALFNMSQKMAEKELDLSLAHSQLAVQREQIKQLQNELDELKPKEENTSEQDKPKKDNKQSDKQKTDNKTK